MSDRTNSTSPRVRKHIVGSCKGILNRGANGVSSFIGLSVSGGLMGGANGVSSFIGLSVRKMNCHRRTFGWSTAPTPTGRQTEREQIK